MRKRPRRRSVPGSARRPRPGFPDVLRYRNEEIYPRFVDDDGTYADQWDGPLHPVRPDPGGLPARGDSENADVTWYAWPKLARQTRNDWLRRSGH